MDIEGKVKKGKGDEGEGCGGRLEIAGVRAGLMLENLYEIFSELYYYIK